MRSARWLLLVLVASCSFGDSGDVSTTVQTVPALPPLPSSTIPTTTTDPPLAVCPDLQSFPSQLPARVVSGLPDTSEVAFDEFTVIEGTFAALRFDADGQPVMAMIRGALPPRQFTEESQVVEVLDGIPALVGPIGDGYWAAAWAIPPGDRCDLYSLIFYPPVEPSEALSVTASVRS